MRMKVMIGVCSAVAMFALFSNLQRAFSTDDESDEQHGEAQRDAGAEIPQFRGLERLPTPGGPDTFGAGEPVSNDGGTPPPPGMAPNSATSVYPDGSSISSTGNPDGSRTVTWSDPQGNVTRMETRR